MDGVEVGTRVEWAEGADLTARQGTVRGFWGSYALIECTGDGELEAIKVFDLERLPEVEADQPAA